MRVPLMHGFPDRISESIEMYDNNLFMMLSCENINRKYSNFFKQLQKKHVNQYVKERFFNF